MLQAGLILLNYVILGLLFLNGFLQFMFEEVHRFERGTIYRIINRKTRRCLSATFHNITSATNEETFQQLWLVSEIKNDQFEIVQFKTGEVLYLTENKPEVKLDKGKLKNNQLWTFEKAQVVNDVPYFWIRPSKNSSLLLCTSAMSEKVKVAVMDQTLQICLWQFLPCSQESHAFKELSVFHSDLSKLVVDVPEYTHKEGTALIQYRYHGGGNQRWIIALYNSPNDQQKQFTIKSYCSGLYLTASFFKLGFRATQTMFNYGPDQRWRLIPVKDGKFLLQSVSNEHYYLGIQSDKGGSILTMTHQQEKAVWKIEGYCPSI